MDKESIEKTVKETPWTPGNDGTAHGSVAGGEMRRHQTSSGIIYRFTVATIIAAVTLVLALALCGCTTTTKYVPVERGHWHTDTVTRYMSNTDSVTVIEHVYESDHRYDSIAPILDSLNRVIGWDRYHYREITQLSQAERTRLMATIDSLLAVSADTLRVQVPYPVERKLTAWEQVKQDAGGWAMAALTVLLPAAAWVIGRRMRKPR